MFGMVSRMVGMKGFDLVQSVADGLVDRGIQLVTWAAGEKQYESFFSGSVRPSSGPCGHLHWL